MYKKQLITCFFQSNPLLPLNNPAHLLFLTHQNSAMKANIKTITQTKTQTVEKIIKNKSTTQIKLGACNTFA